MPKTKPSARCLLAPLTAAVATLLFATPGLAQQARPGELLGMRYLSWAGKPSTPNTDGLRRPGAVAAPQQIAAVGPAPAQPSASRPNRYGAPMHGGSGLTPASAWIGRPVAPTSVTPTPAPQMAAPASQQYEARQAAAPRQMPQILETPATAPSDAQAAAMAPAYDPSRSMRRQDPYFAAPPQVQMAMQPTPPPVSMPAPVPIPTATEVAPAGAPPADYDPMAPRRDAMIFRMNRPATADTAQHEAPQQPLQQQAEARPTQSGQPPREGARYYSVHREAGREPDPLTLPESIFVGGGATPDLAEPPAAPIVQRAVNGRAQVVVPNQDPSLP